MNARLFRFCGYLVLRLVRRVYEAQISITENCSAGSSVQHPRKESDIEERKVWQRCVQRFKPYMLSVELTAYWRSQRHCVVGFKQTFCIRWWKCGIMSMVVTVKCMIAFDATNHFQCEKPLRFPLN